MLELYKEHPDIRFADFMDSLGYFSLPTDNNAVKSKGIDVICDINGERKTFNTSLLSPSCEKIGKSLKINKIYDDNIDVEFLVMEYDNGWLLIRLDFIKEFEEVLLNFEKDGYSKKYQYTFMLKT